MKTSICKTDLMNNNPAPQTGYNRDFARICIALHEADTLRDAEHALVAAWHFASQLDPLVTSVSYGSTYGFKITLRREDRNEANPWAMAAWRGFCRALVCGRLSLASAAIVPVRNALGIVAAVSITAPTMSQCQPLPLHLSLELYAAEIAEEERTKAACRPPRHL